MKRPSNYRKDEGKVFCATDVDQIFNKLAYNCF